MDTNDTINPINQMNGAGDNPSNSLLVADNPGVYIAKNGAIMDRATGRIISGKNNNTKFTTEKIRELKEREALARIQAASSFRSGMARGLGLKSAVAAWGEIGAKQSELAVDTSKGLSSTRAAEFVGKASGFMVKDQENQANSGGMSIHLGSEAANLLISKLSERFKQGD
jgi:hypothetical protein